MKRTSKFCNHNFLVLCYITYNNFFFCNQQYFFSRLNVVVLYLRKTRKIGHLWTCLCHLPLYCLKNSTYLWYYMQCHFLFSKLVFWCQVEIKQRTYTMENYEKCQKLKSNINVLLVWYIILLSRYYSIRNLVSYNNILLGCQ